MLNWCPEINECWEEIIRQIKTSKRKYRKVQVCGAIAQNYNDSTSELMYNSTLQIIKNSWHEKDPVEHRDLLKNLLFVVAQGKMKPSSDEFNKIRTLVRKFMPIHLLKVCIASICQASIILKIQKIKDAEYLQNDCTWFHLYLF